MRSATSMAQICIAALDACDEIWIQLGLVFQMQTKPFIQLPNFRLRKGQDLLLEIFKSDHDVEHSRRDGHFNLNPFQRS